MREQDSCSSGSAAANKASFLTAIPAQEKLRSFVLAHNSDPGNNSCQGPDRCRPSAPLPVQAKVAEHQVHVHPPAPH